MLPNNLVDSLPNKMKGITNNTPNNSSTIKLIPLETNKTKTLTEEIISLFSTVRTPLAKIMINRKNKLSSNTGKDKKDNTNKRRKKTTPTIINMKTITNPSKTLSMNKNLPLKIMTHSNTTKIRNPINFTLTHLIKILPLSIKNLTTELTLSENSLLLTITTDPILRSKYSEIM